MSAILLVRALYQSEHLSDCSFEGGELMFSCISIIVQNLFLNTLTADPK